MQSQYRHWITLSGLAVELLLAAVPAHANLILNGGFEEPVVVGIDPAIGTYKGYYHRNGNELTGWTTHSTYRGTVQFNTDYATVTDGSQAVQLEVSGDSISQSFLTNIGQRYVLSFDWSAGPYSTFSVVLNVAIGPTSETLTGLDRGYVHEILTFTADSLVTTLTFESSFGPFAYPHVDNVSVESAVPAPETIALLSLGLAGLALSRRKRA